MSKKNKKKKFISRRDFLKQISTGGKSLFLLSSLPIISCKLSDSNENDNNQTPNTNDQNPPTELGGRVIHAYNSMATSWDFSSGYYGDYVNQSIIDDMVDQGLMRLTGESTVSQAWQTLIPDYSAGKAIAIKVNFNNCGGCDDSSIVIDALIHPINSIIQGLKQIGVAEQDIWIYDASRIMTYRFTNGCNFSNVRFIGKWVSPCTEGTTFTSSESNAVVAFSPPPGTPSPTTQRIADLLIDASYLINIPIMKTHGAGITLSFKNHFGTIYRCADLHDYIYNGGAHYDSNYNPMVDIYKNTHIQNKTVLTIGDGLFGNWVNNWTEPVRWDIFNNEAPNSLFFAVDPVAVDCVMADFLDAELIAQRGYGLPGMSDDYLQLAANAELGIYERGNPLATPYGDGYSLITYERIEG